MSKIKRYAVDLMGEDGFEEYLAEGGNKRRLNDKR